MSAAPYFYLEHKNTNTHEWEVLSPFLKREDGSFVRAELWDANGSHEMFSILKVECTYDGDYPECEGICYGMPYDVSKEVKETYDRYYNNENKENDIFPSSKPNVYSINLAHIRIYILENPEMTDWDETPEDAETSVMGENLLKPLYDRAISFIDICDELWYDSDLTNYRIVYWLDW